MSTIDLSLCSSAHLTKLTWKVFDDNYGSDHFLISIEVEDNTPETKTSRLIIQKINWAKFYNLTYIVIPPDVIELKTVRVGESV